MDQVSKAQSVKPQKLHKTGFRRPNPSVGTGICARARLAKPCAGELGAGRERCDRRAELLLGLTVRQRAFIVEKLAGLNDKDAAIMAGYSLRVSENTKQRLWTPAVTARFEQFGGGYVGAPRKGTARKRITTEGISCPGKGEKGASRLSGNVRVQNEEAHDSTSNARESLRIAGTSAKQTIREVVKTSGAPTPQNGGSSGISRASGVGSDSTEPNSGLRSRESRFASHYSNQNTETV